MGFLLPDLANFGTNRERLALYASTLLIGIFSIVLTVISAASSPDKVIEESANLLSLGGLALVTILALTWRILWRENRTRSAEASVNVSSFVHVHSSPTAMFEMK